MQAITNPNHFFLFFSVTLYLMNRFQWNAIRCCRNCSDSVSLFRAPALLSLHISWCNLEIFYKRIYWQLIFCSEKNWGQSTWKLINVKPSTLNLVSTGKTIEYLENLLANHFIKGLQIWNLCMNLFCLHRICCVECWCRVIWNWQYLSFHAF